MGPLDARLLLWYAKISAPQAMMVSTMWWYSGIWPLA